jgi:hypothetical protein
MNIIFKVFLVFSLLLANIKNIQGKPSNCTRTILIDSVSIPLYFGLHDDYASNGITSVQIMNDKDSIILNHTGKWKNWGSTYQTTLIKKGKYKILVNFFQDSLSIKHLEESFELQGTELMIDVTIGLMNRRESYNDITVNKYYGNQLNIELKRIWNPQKQFESKKSLLPDYEIVNNSDSTLYGIYHRRSSSMSIGWHQLHDISFFAIQKFENNYWQSVVCNAPRIQMSLKPKEIGTTLKDMVNDCPKKNFKRKGKYRIAVEYGINNAVVRKTEKLGEKTCIYAETYVYRIYDEFVIK